MDHADQVMTKCNTLVAFSTLVGLYCPYLRYHGSPTVIAQLKIHLLVHR